MQEHSLHATSAPPASPAGSPIPAHVPPRLEVGVGRRLQRRAHTRRVHGRHAPGGGHAGAARRRKVLLHRLAGGPGGGEGPCPGRGPPGGTRAQDACGDRRASRVGSADCRERWFEGLRATQAASAPPGSTAESGEIRNAHPATRSCGTGFQTRSAGHAARPAARAHGSRRCRRCAHRRRSPWTAPSGWPARAPGHSAS